MWDFPDNSRLQSIAARIYENNGIVSAVCHGPAGIVNIRLSNGKYLVEGKKVNAFTNEEEAAVKLDKVVPFLLESTLAERGAYFEKSGLWQTHVTVDRRLITGQNPQSAMALGQAILQELAQLEMTGKITRYEVKKGHVKKFRKALEDYVMHSVANESNIMAEAYYDQEAPTVLWLIERWKDSTAMAVSGHTKQARALASFVSKLAAPAKTYTIKDLEPLSREQWRKTSGKEDQQLVVMLFVDAVPGTQQNFKDTYHTAMPLFRSEPGVVTYQLSEIAGDNTQFVTYEKFRSPDAFRYHLSFPPVKPILQYLETSIKEQPFQKGLHTLIEFSPMARK